MISDASLLFIIIFFGGGLIVLLGLRIREDKGCRAYKKPEFEAKTPEPEDLPPVRRGIVSGQRVGAVRKQIEENAHNCCPKCGNPWISDRALTMTITKSITNTTLKKRDVARYHCIRCKYEWGRL